MFPTHKLKGEDLDDENDLNRYYFGARRYDPHIGGFLGVDRFADKYPSLSPYQYCANNPLLLIDVSGDTLELIGDEQQRQLALDAIRGGLPKEVGDAIQVIEVNGRYFIDDKALNNARNLSESQDFLALRQIVNSPGIGQLKMIEKNVEFQYFHKGEGKTITTTFEKVIPGANVFVMTFTTDIANTIYDRTNIITNIPGVNQVFVNTSYNIETIVQKTAHELYGHLHPHLMGQRASHYIVGDTFDQRVKAIEIRALLNFRRNR